MNYLVVGMATALKLTLSCYPSWFKNNLDLVLNINRAVNWWRESLVSFLKQPCVVVFYIVTASQFA